MKIKRTSIYILFCSTLFIATAGIPVLANQHIVQLTSLSLSKNNTLKKLRKDIRTSIIVIKSHREASKLPDLKLHQYRIRSNDTFWTVISRCSQNIDTMMTLNSLSSPNEVYPGKIIYIPNMRGLVLPVKKTTTTQALAHTYNIPEEYITQVNGKLDGSQKYVFIPCARLNRIQRGLFMGRGFIYPLKNARQTSGFGMRRNPFQKHKRDFHAGIDLACKSGTHIHATRAGTVIFSGYMGGYGKLVIIQHDHGYTSYYGHLSKQLVRNGQKVSTGQVIALSGNTGRTTGPHLHFEIRKKSKPVNPKKLIRRR